MSDSAFLAQCCEAFEGVAVPTIVSTLGKYGLRTRFFDKLRPISSANSRFVGEAFTLRTVPVREDLRDAINAGKQRNPHREALSKVGPGHVLVFDARGTDTVSLIGDIIARYLLRQGVVAVVTDSGVGDGAGIDALGLPVFSAGSAPVPGSNRLQIADSQQPVGCAGVAVYPGDIIVGDDNGVVCIPRDIALEVGKKVQEQEALERFLMQCLDEGAPLETTYPPDQKTLERYAQYQAQQAASAG